MPAKPDPQAALKKVIAALEAKFGKGTFHLGSESVPVNHLPFFEPNLNRCTEGGAPFGRFIAEYGDESTGKTRTAYELIAQLQGLPGTAEATVLPRIAYHQALAQDTSLSDIWRELHTEKAERLQAEIDWIREAFPDGGEAVYYNIEQQYDPVYASKIGIDTSRLHIVESTTIEEIAEIMQGLYAHYPMHVVDSTSSASSLLQQKQEMGKSLVGTDARQWKICLRDSMRFFDPARNMGILIHQMGTNIRTGGGEPASSKFLKHTSSCSIKFVRGRFLWNVGGVLKEDKPDGADKASMAGQAEADGVEVFAKIEKSRTCRPMRVAGLQFSYKDLRFVTEHDLASNALHMGIVRQSGSWFSVDGEDQTLGQGMKTVYERLKGDDELCQTITNRMLDYTAESL